MFNKLIILLLLISLNYQLAFSEIGGFWVDENHICYMITSENPKEVSICDVTSALASRIIIPETVVHPYTDAVYTVTEIGRSAFSGANCTYIKLPSAITDIGEKAFSGCHNLEIIDLPGKLKTIGEYAFLSCNSLKSITIPQTVREIGHHAFYDCRSLETVVYNAQNCTNMSEDPLFPENIKTLKIGNNVVTIPDFAFTNCKYLTSLTLPSSITSIGEEAFSWCEGIKKVTIGENVKKIGRYAFHTTVDGLETVEFLATSCEECTHPFNGVKNLIIGDKVKNIPEYAFEFLGISSLSIPDSVESIGSMAFSNCYNLSEVTIGENVKHCGARIFNDCKNLEKLHFNATNCDSFDSPQSLKEVTIGENVKAIPYYAFYQCAELESIDFGNSLISINTGAFSDCAKLSTVKIPNSVVKIGEAAFYNCVGLKSLKLGNSINSIEDNAFYNCINLEKVEFASIQSLVNIDFESRLSNPLYFGHKLYINGAEVREVVIPSTISTIGNYTFAGCSSLTSVIIPTTIHSIGEAAFTNCSSLTKLYIPNSVTIIGINAFESCASLTSISIPNSVTIIEAGAFGGCSSLESIYIPASVTIIEAGAFTGCENLKKAEFSSIEAICNTKFESYSANPLYYARKMFINEIEITDLNIPDSVTKIGDYTFCNGSSFKSVIVPSSINSIGIDAFYNCTQLVDIYSINPVPPMCHNSSFRNVPQWANVYVPVSAIPNYQTANAWSVFFNYHEHDFSGIENIMCENLFAETKVFTLNGVCINSKATQKDIDNLPAGVYIINGKKVKIINAY